MARRRSRDVAPLDVSDLTDDERREAFVRWWYAMRDAQDRALRTGDDAYFIRWLAEHPRPGPDLYAHLRDDPRGRG